MALDLQTVRDRATRLALENAVRHGSAPRPESVLGGLLGSDPSLRGAREELLPLVREVVEEVARLTPEERGARLAALPASQGAPSPTSARSGGEGGLPPLPGAEVGKVVLRFAPFPSGPLHIGHARAVTLNDAYRQRYQGKFSLVFDDTAGSEEKRIVPEAYDMIREDLEEVLGVTPDAYYYKSDRLEAHYNALPQLIRVGRAYVCTCPADQLRSYRENGIACPEREQEESWQLEHWEKMLGGAYSPGQAVVRLKTDLQHPNPAFRDRVLLRISELDHPRVGHRYRVWPMLEYSWAVDDIELGVTHVLRGKELVIEDLMEQAIWDALGWKGPSFAHWGLLQIRGVKLSKSKAQKEVASGEYDGWADPRTWTFRSLRRRGIRAEALRSFVLSFGMSLADIEVPIETLYSENRKLLDHDTPRRSFVPDSVEVRVDGFPSALSATRLKNHPDRPELGERQVELDGGFFLPRADLEKNRGSEIRLKDLLNVQLPSEVPGSGPVHATFTSLPNRPLPRIQWVSSRGALPVEVLQVDGTTLRGTGEAALAQAPPGALFQFERFGFVRKDTEGKPAAEASPRFVFAHP